MQTLRKKILFSFSLMIILSIVWTASALAGVSISGNSTVYPGKSYTYTVKVTANASSMFGKATSGGVFEIKSVNWGADSSTGYNQNLTATCKITVNVPSNAEIGSTGAITVSGQASTYDSDTGVTSIFYPSGSKTITVVAPPTPPPPTKWELAIREIKKVDEGGSITVEMNPEKEKEIFVPVEVFQAIKDGKVILTIDYGSFACIIDGATVGEVPDGLEDINVGVTLQPAQRPEDMLVFDMNNTQPMRYIATYVLEPFLSAPDGLIYVYRDYTGINLLEYVNAAGLDEEGNVLVKIFAPGRYVVSAASILGAEGNMDEATFIELFATPTPEPTPVPTATPEPTPTPQPEKVADEKQPMSILTLILAGILAAMIIALLISIIIRMKRKTKH